MEALPLFVGDPKDGAARQAGIALEAMLLAPILRPMLGDAGGLGDYGLQIVAQEVAARDAHGFAALIAARLESEP
jgi:hypothetical protein